MSRHAGYDNCKNVFIFYVVLLHLFSFDSMKWTGANAHWSPEMNALFHSYTLWHEKLSVPGFVFLSGYFGKGFRSPSVGKKANVRWEKTISILLIGSGLVQFAHFALGSISSKIFTGEWMLPPMWFPLWDKLETWYLIALFLWRLSTPLIGRLRYPLACSFFITFICLHAHFEGPVDMR